MAEAKRLKRDMRPGASAASAAPPDPRPSAEGAPAAEESVAEIFRRRRRETGTTIRLADPMATRIGTRIDPNALIFDSEWYRAVHPDVAASRVDPVRHYFDNGAGEGRNPNPYFDTKWYASKNPDVGAAGLNPFLHFLLYGAHEGRLPAPGLQEAEPASGGT